MDKVGSNINRVKGQIDGVKRMYEEERDCMEIVQQIVAVRSALAGIAKDLLQGEASACAKSKGGQKDFDRMLKTLVELS